MEGKGMDRRGFIIGSAAAAAGLSIGLPSLAYGDLPAPLPTVGAWPYAELDAHQIGEWAAHGVRDEAGALLPGYSSSG